MPIYAYKCESCGFAKDVLQKISDAQLQDCPQCNAPAFKKQVTAAGFQLKGSGWYVTDFKGGNAPAPASAGAPAGTASSPGAAGSGSDGGAAPSEAASAPKSEASPAAPTAAASSTTSSPTP